MSWKLGAQRVRAEGSAQSGEDEVAPDSPRVLVVGTDDWAIEQSAAALVEAGFGVLRCHEPGEPEFPCNALIEGRTCPLEVGFHVVATVRARPLDTMAPGEMGVVCALRTGIPLVAAGVAPDRPFGPWAAVTVEQGGELVNACEKVAGEAFAEVTGEPPVAAPMGGL
ncbi:MAG: hypothetical protein ACRDY1_14290 [Acidimicrobiales bacterium]